LAGGQKVDNEKNGKEAKPTYQIVLPFFTLLIGGADGRSLRSGLGGNGQPA
jgi:hypothetical protein